MADSLNVSVRGISSGLNVDSLAVAPSCSVLGNNWRGSIFSGFTSFDSMFDSNGGSMGDSLSLNVNLLVFWCWCSSLLGFRSAAEKPQKCDDPQKSGQEQEEQEGEPPPTGFAVITGEFWEKGHISLDLKRIPFAVEAVVGLWVIALV
jgi:hypothetical protein